MDEPFAKVGIPDRTGRDRPSVLIQVDGHAAYRASRDEGIQIVGGLRATPVLQTVFAAAELGAFRRVDAPQADPRSVNFQRVSVDDAGLPHQVGSQGGTAK